MVRLLALLVGDVGAFLLAWGLAVAGAVLLERGVWHQLWPFNSPVGSLFVLGALAALGVFAFLGQYTKRAAFWDEVSIVWRSLAIVALGSFALSFFAQVAYTRTQFLLAWVLAFLLIPMARLAMREMLLLSGQWRLRALVVGQGINADEARLAILQERHLGLEVVATVGEMTSDVALQAQALECSTVIIAPQNFESPRPRVLAEVLTTTHRFDVLLAPPLWGLPVHGMQIQSFVSSDAVFLRLQQNLLKRRAIWTKRVADVIGASLALLLFSPLMLWAALRIWLEDGRPIFYRQMRIGEGGHEFGFYKFRSMVRDADQALELWRTDHPELYAKYQKNFKLADDPRLLRCGKWLRRMSIDELPQLWNVLRGEMSMVGPRPFLHRELERVTPEAIASYKSVKPGITGLWQVSGRSNAAFEQRLALDNWYVRNWSLWLDFVILMKTVRVVLTGRGAL
ncbi:exopolysaccharide biosynthesis polyprenyl glycosylphosphotransferase [Hylemonella gracilis]|uniref:Undecaprenyl-phosphate galactose phosphotransferase, WbaP n=1 Tax=Hylemonella gracilis ATCC 19624 TaxID=887062 RepID=F3KSF2_9BURK|nr:exopolysaccharide biosynthesis polyprenyl glycosylphosphotransferase [Hylemonella gracilis]EGI77346.1 Undecaprenyl-phosphate galactose phosphotransferase, WbaP [Hylemonella gracilis ATCC 19624]